MQNLDPEAVARKMGFKDAKTAEAYYKRQREMQTGPAGGPTASSGSLLDTAFAWHPKVLFEHILSKFNKATGKQ